MIWEHGEEELQKFLETLNCYRPTIKFIAEYSRLKKNFLDVIVMKKGNQLVTDLYVKPTDIHQYLHASWCHISHCKKSIPFSQNLRLNRICSEKVPIIVFRRAKSLKDILVRTKIAPLEKEKRLL